MSTTFGDCCFVKGFCVSIFMNNVLYIRREVKGTCSKERCKSIAFCANQLKAYLLSAGSTCGCSSAVHGIEFGFLNKSTRAVVNSSLLLELCIFLFSVFISSHFYYIQVKRTKKIIFSKVNNIRYQIRIIRRQVTLNQTVLLFHLYATQECILPLNR